MISSISIYNSSKKTKTNFLGWIYFHKLLIHELSHARILESVQKSHKPYIVFGSGCDGRKESELLDCSKSVYKGFNLYFLSGWETKHIAFTDIEDRKVLTLSQIKKSVIAPVKNEWLIFMLGIFLALPFLYNLPKTNLSLLTLYIIGMGLMIFYFPSGAPFISSKKVGTDMYLYKHPEEYYLRNRSHSLLKKELLRR